MRDKHFAIHQNLKIKRKRKKEKDKNKKKSKKGGGEGHFWGRQKTVEMSEREREREKRGVEREIFFLRSIEIRPSVFVVVRGKSIHALRVTCGYQNHGVLSNSTR